MAQEAVGSVGEVPQRGTLLRRAHELLESIGQPTAEDLLIQHLFGVSEGSTGRPAVWTMLLRQTLQSSSLFEQADEQHWSLSAWRSTQLSLNEVEFVVLDTEFTGITQEMVAGAPGAEQIFPDFLQFIEGAILVGHNVGFDIGFLSYEAQLLGYAFPIDGLDTIPLARRFLPGLRRFKLDVVAGHLKIPMVNRHRALGDAKVTAAIFMKLLNLARQEGIYTLGNLRRRLQLPVAWSGDITDASLAKQVEYLRADGKLSSKSVTSRPTGSLLLNPAWKREFPNKPGVYLMREASGQVIYVGKAKCLKDRLASYYSHPLGYTRKMDGLLQNVKEIETIVLGSELEALLMESQLIKQLQPVYNVQLRNYDLYPFIKIDVQHPFPRVFSSREVASDGARYFGPFRSRRMVDLTIDLIQKVFPVRTCTRSLPPQAKPSEPCLRLHLDRCPGPCRGGVDPLEYARVIEQVCAFLGGEREDLLDRMRRQMLEAAQQLNFERAAWLRDTIRSADEVLIGQRLITGAVEANNLFIVYPSAKEEHNELFLIRHGRLVEQRCIAHELEAMETVVHELLARAAVLGDPPSIVGKAEVDQINIISRWIHRHSDDRAFFPLQPALTDIDEARRLAQRIWVEIDTVRATPIVVGTDQEEDMV